MRVYIGWLGVLPELRGFKHADKVTHAIYGAVIGGIAAGFGAWLRLDSYLIALVAATVAGIAKEVYDAQTCNGRWDPWDILATMILPLLAWLVV